LESIAALDAGDLDNLDKFIADDYVRHCQATPGVIIASLDDFKALLREWEGTYSDVVTTVDVMIAEGDLVAFYGSYTAVQIGPMGPFPATGKQLVSEFAGYHRIADGKITETWVTWDNLAALVQLGLFPPPKEESSRSD
jgi:predicted ester cyclase